MAQWASSIYGPPYSLRSDQVNGPLVPNIKLFWKYLVFKKKTSTLNQVFWENSSQRFVALIFTLLLVHFKSKLVKFLTRSQSLKKRKGQNSQISPIFKSSLRLWLSANLYPKCTKRSINVGATNLFQSLKNVFLNVNSKPVKNHSVHTY